jgi:DNA repair exonuclease SbcCD nuclease subunit
MVGDGKDDKEATDKFMETLKPADVAFFHQGITGAKTHGSMVDLFNELVFPLEKLESLYGKVFSGHIHQHQKIGTKTQMTGSVFSMEVGDHTKQVYLYDTVAKETEAIPLPVRGIFSIQNEEIDREDIPTSSIVKCTITKKDTFDIDKVKTSLGRFDAYVLIEQYPSERRKLHLEQANMDLDIHSLLRVYANARNVEYNILKEGLDLLQNS